MSKENERIYYVERTIATPYGESKGYAGPFTKEEAEEKARLDTYNEGNYRQWCKVIQQE